MKQGIWKFFLGVMLIMASLMYSGCGGGGGASTFSFPPLPVFVPGSVTEPDRTRAIGEVSDFYKTVAGQPDAMDQVVTFMKTRPEFATAEKSKSGDAVGFFKDGRMYMVAQPTPQLASRPANTHALPPNPSATTTRELPGANKAYLINIELGARFDTIPIIDPVLTTRGFDTIVLEGAVGDFAQIRDAGVLYLKTLGMKSRNQFNEEHIWFLTATPVNDETTALYQSQLDAGTMSTVSLRTNVGNVEPTYGNYMVVSEKFIQNSGMSFRPNALWINEAAWGADPLARVHSPNVQAYWSWSGRFYEGDAFDTTILLFARLLGTRAFVQLNEDVPYTIGEAMGDLNITPRLTGGAFFNQTSYSASSKFDLYVSTDLSLNVDDLTMIPSIRSATVDKAENTMTIEGYFGTESGPVTINGSTLNVRSWTPRKVIVDAPTVTEGGIVLRSLGGASASGQLLSKVFYWRDLVFKINPENIFLKRQETKSFAVTTTGGTVPNGTTYRWTLDGQGTINGTTTVNGTASSVSFRAANTDGETTLKVEVFLPSGGKLGEAFAQIGVGENALNYTASGQINYPQFNGTFAHNDGRGTVFTQQGRDLYEFGYNIDTVNDYPRVVVFLIVPANTVLAAGQTYNNSANAFDTGFTFGTTESLTGPTLDGNILLYGGNGTLTITSVTSNPDGTKSLSYTFSLVGATSGSGTSGSGSIVVTREN